MANPYGPYATTPLLGANFKQTSTTALFALGTSMLGTDDSLWVYVQSDVVVAANVTVAQVTPSNWHMTAATGGTYATAVAFAINDYGWVQKTATL